VNVPTPVAALDDLSIAFPAPDGGFRPVIDALSLAIGPGERVAMVGPSGCGKSLSALALLGLVPKPGRFVSGSITIDGVELSDAPVRTVRDLRGGTAALVFQEAEAALNPVMTVGAHLRETIARHRSSETRHWKTIALDLLRQVDLEPERTLAAHPHRLSGGQRQRVLLAIALAGDPRLLIADEPTSSLDVLTQATILTLIDRLCRDRGTALLLISHDIGVVSGLTDRVLVMLAGRIVEEAPIDAFLDDPLHPYSRILVETARGNPVVDAPTTPATRDTAGCTHAPDCPLRVDSCLRTMPDLIPVASDRRVRCPVVAGEPR